MGKLFISPEERKKYDEKTIEWGEKGAAHNIGHTPVSPNNRTTITLGGANDNIAANSTERQKQRTFT